jgi:copper chaperone
MTQVVLRIDGMHCGACVRRVTQALQSVSGIEAEEVRVGAARLKVQDLANAEAAIEAINKAGYPAYQEK